MPNEKSPAVRLQRLSVKNFKALDSLDIEFPRRATAIDPDVFVMGSRNGIGKTSVLEACALLFYALLFEPDGPEGAAALGRNDLPPNTADLLIRAGAKSAVIKGQFAHGRSLFDLTVTVGGTGTIKISGDKSLRELIDSSGTNRREGAYAHLLSLLGSRPDPFILHPLLYFHSYRKVQEGSPELGAMVESGGNIRRLGYARRVDQTISRFKLEVLRSLMSQAELFENVDEPEAASTLDAVNNLMKKYAGGIIAKLRPAADNTVEFRISPIIGGASFSFDGLSSGQKEIISTLFLIWRYTKKHPGIVLIDEPELHLNVEWHRRFIRDLAELVPGNQYIIATHSEDIFATVDETHRILLVPDEMPVAL